jgi:hypothetical protein
MSDHPIRCAACKKRIRPKHPHIGMRKVDDIGEFVKDRSKIPEVSYHSREECMKTAAETFARLMKRGALYWTTLYHVCGDEQSGYFCRGGCFSGLPLQLGIVVEP